MWKAISNLSSLSGARPKGSMSRAHLELRWVHHLLCLWTFARSFLSSPGPWLLYSPCSYRIGVFALSFDQFGKKDVLSPRAEGNEPWAAQVWSCRLPGSFASHKSMAHPEPHTPFKPSPPGALEEPVRRPGTLWSLNTKRQLRGSGEDMSLISKTPSHWASSRCKSP